MENLEEILEKPKKFKKVKKVLDYSKVIYFGGTLPEKNQRKFAESVNLDTKKLTILNSLVFGSGAAFFGFVLGEEGSYLISKIWLGAYYNTLALWTVAC